MTTDKSTHKNSKINKETPPFTKEFKPKGVPAGKCVPLAIGNTPRRIVQYAKLEIIIGPKTTETNINGLSTIAVLKIIRSLIPNIAGSNDILPNVLYRLLFEKNNNKIANPIVAPEPPITTKEL